MSYSCPECADGVLETKLREVDLELADDEIAFIVGGVAVITRVGCNNGCSAETEEAEVAEVEETEEVEATAAPAVVEQCTKSPGCRRSAGHRGRHTNAFAVGGAT
jgi:hypothetical protein